MNEPEVVLATILTAVRSRIVNVLPDQIRAAVAQLSDEQIWWRPNESSNSVGNLIVHLTGSLNHFLNRALGGMKYERDRDAEFAERGPIPRDQLLAGFDFMLATAGATINRITIERLGDTSPEPRFNKIVAEDLLGVLTHISAHTGQILWIAKMLQKKPLDEVWMKTHRQYVWQTKD